MKVMSERVQDFWFFVWLFFCHDWWFSSLGERRCFLSLGLIVLLSVCLHLFFGV